VSPVRIPAGRTIQALHGALQPTQSEFKFSRSVFPVALPPHLAHPHRESRAGARRFPGGPLRTENTRRRSLRSNGARREDGSVGHGRATSGPHAGAAGATTSKLLGGFRVDMVSPPSYQTKPDVSGSEWQPVFVVHKPKFHQVRTTVPLSRPKGNGVMHNRWMY
jgi:hypothetical protein